MNIDKEEIIKKMKNDIRYFVDVSKFDYDLDLILNAIVLQRRYDLIQVLNERKLMTAEITKELIKKEIKLYPFLNKKFFDKKTCLFVLEKRASAFQVFSNQMKANKEVALYAINRSDENIRFVSPTLFQDADIVKACLKNYIGNIKFIPLNMLLKEEIINFMLERYNEEQIGVFCPQYLEEIHKIQREKSLMTKLTEISNETVVRKKKI